MNNGNARARVVLILVGMLLVACVASLMGASGVALAQEEPYSRESPSVLPTRIEGRPPPQPDRTVTVPGREPEPSLPGIVPSVEPNRIPANRPGILPFTGAQIVTFALAGLALTGTGMLLVRKSRGPDSK